MVPTNQNQEPKTPGNNMPTDGWPTTEEQIAYWQRRDQERKIRDSMPEVLNAFAVFLGDLNEAIGKLSAKLHALNK